MDRQKAAVLAHEVNKAYCEALGDHSQVHWSEASPEIQASCHRGVYMYMNNPNATPEQSHENWMEGKEADGWEYGEEKDEKEKTHPCMVPYEELPVEQRAKDYIFRAVVLNTLAMGDM